MREMRSELAFESLFTQSCEISQQRNISAATDFFDMTYRTKYFPFLPYHEIYDEQAPLQRYLTGYFSVSSEGKYSKSQHILLIGLKRFL